MKKAHHNMQRAINCTRFSSYPKKKLHFLSLHTLEKSKMSRTAINFTHTTRKLFSKENFLDFFLFLTSPFFLSSRAFFLHHDLWNEWVGCWCAVGGLHQH